MRAQMAGAFAVGFAAGMLSLGLLVWRSGHWKAQAGSGVPAAAGAAGLTTAGRPNAPGASVLPRLAMPIAGVDPRTVPDTFDQARDGRKHEAVDIPAPRGTPVHPVADGPIAKLFTSRAGGLTVYQFDSTRPFCYYYAHLDHYAAGLKEGAWLRQGDVLGYVGTTGNAPPNAPHLHLAVFRLGPERKWWKGTAIDPLPLLR